MNYLRPALFGLVGAMVAGGCGSDAAPTGAVERPTGAGDVVVQVLVDGGLLRQEEALAIVPRATVLGDGTVVTPAPVLAIYPGPALAPLQSAKVDAATVDGLVRRAWELGLLDGPLEFGQPGLADASNTTVTIVAGGLAHRQVAYSLGFADETVGGANRLALKSFVAAVQALTPGSQAWEPTAVVARVAGAYQPEPQLPQTPVPWPIARVPVASGAGVPCLVVEGDDLRALRVALAKANARTPWVIAGVARSVVFVPAVPGAPTCPA